MLKCICRMNCCLFFKYLFQDGSNLNNRLIWHPLNNKLPCYVACVQVYVCSALLRTYSALTTSTSTSVTLYNVYKMAYVLLYPFIVQVVYVMTYQKFSQIYPSLLRNGIVYSLLIICIVIKLSAATNHF